MRINVGFVFLFCVSLGAAMNVLGADDRNRETHYPSPFYKLRAIESNETGVHKVRIDNRVLEVTLPDPAPDEFFMPEAVVSKGDEAFKKLLQQRRGTLTGFTADWRYGMLRGVFTPLVDDSDHGGIGVTVKVMPHTRVVVNDPSVNRPVGTVGNVVSHRKSVELDYFKLDDFIQAVCGEGGSNRCRVEVINGRQWVREIVFPQPATNLATYGERLHTQLDRQRIMTIGIGLSDDIRRYATPDSQPQWMQKVNRSLEAVLRSIKLSPPDDGSPDPFLIDPEQKPGETLVEFPARRK